MFREMFSMFGKKDKPEEADVPKKPEEAVSEKGGEGESEKEYSGDDTEGSDPGSVTKEFIREDRVRRHLEDSRRRKRGQESAPPPDV